MKPIDIKSLIIGALLTSTIFLGVAATSTTDKWDDKQEWEVLEKTMSDIRVGKRIADNPFAFTGVGWEPIGVQGANIIWRKRVK